MSLESLPGFGGVKVTEVTPGGIGHHLRFRRGDVITTVNGAPVDSPLQFQRVYVVNNRRQIVLGVIRNGRPGTVTIDERSLPGRPGPRPPQGPTPITTKLELSTFQDREGKVTVAGGSEQGLGKQLGIAIRGTRILEINGQPIRRTGDLNKIDEAIAAGRVTRLVISIIRPDGARQTVSFPNNRRGN
jgi:S1-C subfamily serine protease